MIASIVELFRSVIGAIYILGLAVVLIAGFLAFRDGGGVLVMVGVILGAASVVLIVGIGAVLIQIADEMKAMRRVMEQQASRAAVVPGPRVTAGTDTGRPRLSSVGAGDRRLVKSYKGKLIEKDANGTIIVDDQSFPGVIAAEQYIRSIT